MNVVSEQIGKLLYEQVSPSVQHREWACELLQCDSGSHEEGRLSSLWLQKPILNFLYKCKRLSSYLPTQVASNLILLVVIKNYLIVGLGM